MQNKRLESLDILRGLDMCLLTVIGPIVSIIWGHSNQGILAQFEHVKWEGFAIWDLIMPLFMFMSGVTIPYSMNKYVTGETPKAKAWIRILRRFAALWVLGMISQGNLLKFDWTILRFFSNTLQAIAVGYLFCSIMYLYCQNHKVHIATSVVLLIAFWACMMFIRVGEYGGGDFTREHNLCQYIDNVVLGTHRDCYPKTNYYYTWILSSLTFIVTVMMGMLSGELLRSNNGHKTAILIIGGAVCAAAGWLWGLQMPVIKHIWTSSMTLVAGGYSMMLLGAFYWMVDVKGWGRKAFCWLKPFGANAIVAYMVMELGHIYHLDKWLVIGLVICSVTILWWRKIFVRV